MPLPDDAVPADTARALPRAEAPQNSATAHCGTIRIASDKAVRQPYPYYLLTCNEACGLTHPAGGTAESPRAQRRRRCADSPPRLRPLGGPPRTTFAARLPPCR